MKRYVLLGLCVLVILLGGCKQYTNVSSNSTNIKTDSKLNIHHLSSWDKGILQSVINSNTIGLCKNTKNITYNQCLEIYNQQKLFLKNLDCDKLMFQKQLCLDRLNLKVKNCDNIVNRNIKVQCIYEKNLEKALKNGDYKFCNTLPRTFKIDCEKKFKVSGQR